MTYTKLAAVAVIASLATTPAMAAKKQLAAVSPAKTPPVATPRPQPAMPAPEAMIVLIRSSLVALSQANATNNYTVLSSLGSQDFRTANPPARLAQIFAPFRANRIDLTPVTFVTPQLTQQPYMQNGRMRLVGHFPTQPMQVKFDLMFEPSGGSWKLFGLGVNLAQANAQQAPASQSVKPGR